MKYAIRGKAIEITDAMKDKIISVLSKLEKFRKVIGEESNARIEVKYYRENLARITVFIEHLKVSNLILKADVNDPDFYRALDKIQKDLRDQIVKFIDRVVDNRKKPIKAAIDDDDHLDDEM